MRRRGGLLASVLFGLGALACTSATGDARDPDGGLTPADARCRTCHGDDTTAAPPLDLGGHAETWSLGVGAHRSHLGAALAAPVACDQCHVVPTAVDAENHLDEPPAELTWGDLASANGAVPAWDRQAAICSSVYCHGATLTGGTNTAPIWTAVDGTQAACGTCHGAPPPSPHPGSTACALCHPATVAADGTLDVGGGKHVNGTVDVAAQACNSCHGNDQNAAPPRSVAGATETTVVEVGAHQAHVVAGKVSLSLSCAECHVVPVDADAPGHADPSPSELTWGVLATGGGGTAPAWDRQAAVCSSVYCHGATLTGGTNPAPRWTAVDGTQATCGSCHGVPPPAPHVASTACSLCHPATVGVDGALDVGGGKHVNGTVDVASQACNSCHGNDQNAAPPTSVAGASEISVVEVGAHQAHLADGPVARAQACDQCHVVPAAVDAPGHLDGAPAELTWGALASTGGASPAWDRASATCSGVYCHGATLAGGSVPSPTWTAVDGTQAACGACHGVPPPAPHPEGDTCRTCHPATIGADGAIDVTSGRHVDGQVQVVVSGPCGSCHALPPDTGSHLLHAAGLGVGGAYGDASVTSTGAAYAFGCGNCHPLDPARHGNGEQDGCGHVAEVDLSPTDAPAGSLKARNHPAATYVSGPAVLTDASGMTYTKGTCSGTYCHSAATWSVPAGVKVPEPGVDVPFEGYPMSYPDFPVQEARRFATATWGSSLSCDGCHGFPPRASAAEIQAGAGDSHSWIDEQGFENFHGWNHGYEPVACATCHHDTVTDPGVRTRVGGPGQEGLSSYQPVPVADHAAHVNGAPDVAFTSQPVVLNSSFDLTSAGYDPSSRTCSNVGCHFADNPVAWGTPYRWGNGYECNVCHQY